MTKIIIGGKETRNVPVTATQPLDDDKTRVVKFSIDVEIIDRDEWRAITARWDYLGRKLKEERIALERGVDYFISDEERAEANSPAIESIKHLIKDASLVLETADGQELVGEEKINALIKISWLSDDVFNAVVAAESGKTVAAYKQLRAKN